MEIIELVPMPDNPKFTVKYTELLGHELANRNEYFTGELQRAYPVKLLLDGLVSEAERKHDYLKIPQTVGDTYIKVEQQASPLILQHQDAKQEVKQEVKVDINIKVELPMLQEAFEELKDWLMEKEPKLKGKLNEVGDSLDEVTAETPKEKLAKPMNKLSRFLKKVSDKNSDLHKLISGTKKAVEYAQKLGKTYNKFAQWLALPQIPDVLLKK